MNDLHSCKSACFNYSLIMNSFQIITHLCHKLLTADIYRYACTVRQSASNLNLHSFHFIHICILKNIPWREETNLTYSLIMQLIVRVFFFFLSHLILSKEYIMASKITWFVTRINNAHIAFRHLSNWDNIMIIFVLTN